MKRIAHLLLCAFVSAGVVACAPNRTIVLLSTNDMHAQIQNFPRLAAAVEACRDTTQWVLLVDDGDRWTGNAFVDRAPTPGLPVISLMNRLGYDIATVGNHEFDMGQAYLARMIDSMHYPVICANVVSDTTTFPQLPSDTVLTAGKIKIGFVGAVTNYDGNNTPAGNAADFAGLTFPDPQAMAQKYGEQLRPKCDVLILLSHMGDDRDKQYLEKGASPYNEIIGGHTHVVRDTVINGTLLTQTGHNLQNIGVTTIRMKGHRVVSVDFRNVPLSDYAPDPVYQKEVDGYYADSALNRAVGQFAATAAKQGVANWLAQSAADAVGADVGFYHIGGVRLDSIGRGGVSAAMIYSLDPFATRVASVKMTPEQMRDMIIAKYNDTVNVKESHRIDLISTTPYTILTDAKGDAADVLFPSLREGRVYTVAMPDYVFANYHDINCTDAAVTDKLMTSELLEELGKTAAIVPDNKPRQTVGIYAVCGNE